MFLPATAALELGARGAAAIVLACLQGGPMYQEARRARLQRRPLASRRAADGDGQTGGRAAADRDRAGRGDRDARRRAGRGTAANVVGILPGRRPSWRRSSSAATTTPGSTAAWTTTPASLRRSRCAQAHRRRRRDAGTLDRLRLAHRRGVPGSPTAPTTGAGAPGGRSRSSTASGPRRCRSTSTSRAPAPSTRSSPTHRTSCAAGCGGCCAAGEREGLLPYGWALGEAERVDGGVAVPRRRRAGRQRLDLPHAVRPHEVPHPVRRPHDARLRAPRAADALVRAGAALQPTSWASGSSTTTTAPPTSAAPSARTRRRT